MFKLSFRSFQPMLDADDGFVGGTGAEELEVADPTGEEGAEEPEVAEPVDKSDAAFAEMRRQNEMLTQQLQASNRKAEDLEMSVSEYERALGLYFDGENKAAQAIANHDELPLEQVVSDMQARREVREQEKATETLTQERDRLLFENMKMKDLAELRAAGVTDVNDVEELGEEFFALRAMGIPAKTIYDGIQMKRGTPPKAIGKVKPAVPEKDYFTVEEVQTMSPKERIKNYDKIKASMSRWK